MSVMNAILLMCVFAAVLMGICAVVIWLENKYPGKNYDERQKQARGNAYRFSFWLGLVYHFGLSLAAIWNHSWSSESVDLYLLLYFGLILQAVSFHIYCVFTHAALPMSDNPKASIGCYGLLAVLNLMQFWGYHSIELSFGGESSNKWANLLTGFLFLVLTVLHLLQLFRDRKE